MKMRNTLYLGSMFELSQLRCFVAAAEELHFGRAAQRLNMTQSPLSRQIQLLERILDVTLLERTSRTVSLTPAGRVFLIEARRIVRLAESARCRRGAWPRATRARWPSVSPPYQAILWSRKSSHRPAPACPISNWNCAKWSARIRPTRC
jgi:DNA-binding transcriptional LysR family regulator